MGHNHSLCGPHQDELAHPMHNMVPETNSQNQVSELSDATMIPQMTVAVDLTHNHMVPETTPRNHVSGMSYATINPQMTVAVDPTRSEG